MNNAGGAGSVMETWDEARPATWVASYDRNMLSALRITSHLLPAMRRTGCGRVINISSGAATTTPPYAPDYAASKAALNAMTTSLAKAVAGDNVTVNAASVGTTRRAAQEAHFEASRPNAGWRRRKPFGRRSSAPFCPWSRRFPWVEWAG